MSVDEIEVFQNLLLRAPKSGRPALRRALIAQGNGPWRHAALREADLIRNAGRDVDVIAFERGEGDGVDAVGLVLWEREAGYEVSNIVPREVSELGHRRYNLALRDFVEKVAGPAAAVARFSLETTSATQRLDDWLPRAAVDALKRFSALANKSTGLSHPMDRRRWFAFLLAAHDDHGSFDIDRLLRWLMEVERWPEDTAHDLGIEYEFGLALLDEYDQRRA